MPRPGRDSNFPIWRNTRDGGCAAGRSMCGCIMACPNLACDLKEVLQVVSKRAVEYGGHKQKWLWRVYYPLKRMDPVIRYLHKCMHCFYGTVRIDGYLAASLIGPYAGDGRMIIPRLSYDSAYYRYPPGGMLVDEATKFLLNGDSPRTVRNLNLSRGEERYKYDFGGKEHFNYCFTFSDSR